MLDFVLNILHNQGSGIACIMTQKKDGAGVSDRSLNVLELSGTLTSHCLVTPSTLQ